jgi:hypothetical protein
MRRTLLSLLLVAAPLGVAAGQASSADHEGVRRAVLDYVEGFYEGDSTKHLRSIRPEVFKYGFYIPRDSARYHGQQMTWSGFLAYTRNVRDRKSFRPATDPKEIVIYDVLDQTASAKLTAYWGIDYLLLAKYEGKWMITHVLWQTPPKK